MKQVKTESAKCVLCVKTNACTFVYCKGSFEVFRLESKYANEQNILFNLVDYGI